MLSISLVAVLLFAVTGAAVWAGFSRRSLLLSIGVLAGLGLVLLGLPGAAFLETLEPLMKRLGRGAISADGAWPAAIVMSLVWPAALVPAYYGARAVRGGHGVRGLAALAILGFASAAIGVAVYGMAD